MKTRPFSSFYWCRDTQHNDTQHNNTQHNDIPPSDFQHNDTQHNNKNATLIITALDTVMLSVIHTGCYLYRVSRFLLLCGVSLCGVTLYRVSLCRVSSCRVSWQELDRFTKDENFSLLSPFVSYEENGVLWISTQSYDFECLISFECLIISGALYNKRKFKKPYCSTTFMCYLPPTSPLSKKWVDNASLKWLRGVIFHDYKQSGANTINNSVLVTDGKTF
jgi:hypothetical protein